MTTKNRYYRRSRIAEKTFGRIIRYGRDEFANEHAHSNGIESFWAYVKLRLSKSKGIHKQLFYYPLKETEFRFNHRRDSLYLVLLNLLRE